MKFLTDNWLAIVEVLGGVSLFFAGRKSKRNTEQSGELENIKTVREIEKRLLQDMEDQIVKLIDINNKLEARISKQQRIIELYEAKHGEIRGE